MHPMSATFLHNPTSSKTFLGLLAAICTLAVLAIPGAAAASDSPELSLTFPTGEAHLSDSQASVWVTCEGPEARVCNGTLTLTRGGNKSEVPFSVIAGTNQSLDVPVGVDSKAKRIVAVVRTEQANSAFVRSRNILRLG
jgi:hypothetical protein